MERDDDVIDDPEPRDRRRRIGLYGAVVAAGIALLALGAAGGVLLAEHRAGRARPVSTSRDVQTPAASPDARSMPGMAGMSAPTGRPAVAASEEAVEVSLTPDAIERAGIKITEVKAQSSVS